MKQNFPLGYKGARKRSERERERERGRERERVEKREVKAWLFAVCVFFMFSCFLIIFPFHVFCFNFYNCLLPSHNWGI
jgi:hypothetical protein